MAKQSTHKKAAKKKAVKPKPQRIDHEHNQELISSAFFKLIKQSNGKLPTHKQLAEQTGLCSKTIDRHLKQPRFKEMAGKMRAMNDMMLVHFANKVLKSGDSKMWDLWWTLTEPEYAATKQKQKVDLNLKGGWEGFKLEG